MESVLFELDVSLNKFMQLRRRRRREPKLWGEYQSVAINTHGMGAKDLNGSEPLLLVDGGGHMAW